MQFLHSCIELAFALFSVFWVKTPLASAPTLAVMETLAILSLIIFTFGSREIPTKIVPSILSSGLNVGALVKFTIPSVFEALKPTHPFNVPLTSALTLVSTTIDGVTSIISPGIGEKHIYAKGIFPLPLSDNANTAFAE